MLASDFLLHIVTPTGTLFKKKCRSVTVPTTTGYITILPEHTSLISELSEGSIHITEGSLSHEYVVHRGSIEISPEGVLILSSFALESSAVSQEMVLLAEIRAQELAQKIEQAESIALADLEVELERSLFISRLLKNKNR